ncbi:MAG: sigma factor-like helix-turn-helix DNA-binding protein [Dermatophilus congolensis]|nr:sigma factor-like helix-turn-helix DNA-binding protein [Dermatophilus congolensis]
MHRRGLLERVHRESWGRLLGGLIARTGRADLAEDALAEAFAAAAAQWPTDGEPRNPEGWLMTTARRRVLDAIRAEGTLRAKAHLLASAEVIDHATDQVTVDSDALAPDDDDRLRLLLLATHPALAPESRAALALRFVLGVPTEQIARLFLVPTPTMAARLTRAKKRITAAGLPFAMPADAELPERIDDVARAILLAFTAGYAPGDEHVVRIDVAGEAVRLATVAHGAMPAAEVFTALTALVTLQHSRRAARCRGDDAGGDLVLLEHQDRTLWHHDEIERGLTLLAMLEPGTGYREELRLQAVIAAVHAMAPTARDTDWAMIARAYRRLEALTGSPIVRLNRAVALAEVQGPQAGLALLQAVSEALPDHHRVSLARAEFLRRDGLLTEAAQAYETALTQCPPGAEYRHIEARLRELNSPT